MLKQLILGFCLLLCFSSSLIAQHKLANSLYRSPYTYIYQLTEQQARSIHEEGTQVVRPSFFQSVVDSFAVNTNYSRTLAQGHYLYVHSSGPDLIYSLHTVTPFAVKLIQERADLNVLVHDSLGNPLPNAVVLVDKKKTTYNPATQTYHLNYKPKDALLAVSLNGFTHFVKLEKADNPTRERSFLNKIIYSFPVYYIWRPFYDTYRSVRGWYPEGWVRSVISLFDPQYRRYDEREKYKGYLALNKPKYMPGDTVMYKAFIVDKHGKPYKGKAIVKLGSYRTKQKSLGEIKAYRKGGFDGFFVLHDSLRLDLDQVLTLSLERPNKKEGLLVSASFSYEDYELKENIYTLTLAHDRHYTGQENLVKARGVNANGLNLLDARVEIVVKTRRIIKSEQPLLFVPDTLWQHQQPLNPTGETTITIPKSIFPDAGIEYAVTATFLNASNERTTKTRNATYHHTSGYLSIELQQDSLLVQYREGDKSKPRAATLSAYNADYDDIYSSNIMLPAKVALNAFAAGYEVTSGELFDDLEFAEDDKDASLSLQTARTNDSLYMAIQNPRRLPYWYAIYRGEKLVEQGHGKAAEIVLQLQAKGDKPYFVAVQYVWAGTMHKLQEDVPFRKHLLTIDLQSPQVVYPGQKADLKVAVTDAKGKPVQNVDLTAYGLTSKFKNTTIPALPSWDRYKKQKPFRKLQLQDRTVDGKQLMNWNYWGSRMGLDSIGYYKFLYPENGVFTDYAKTMDGITQVSPFVVDSGRVVPVHVVYLDNVPVYFSQTDVLPAYAFAADSGYHNIKIRTATKLITLDSVYLQHQHKLIVSADISAADNTMVKPAERWKLSDYERRTLSKYLLHVTYKIGDYASYLKQGNKLLLLSDKTTGYYYNRNHERTLFVGPFSPNWMQYVRLNRFTTNFMLEPDYSYSFEPGLLKMREMKMADNKVRLPMWNKSERFSGLLQHEALTERKILENWEAVQHQRLLSMLYTPNPSGTGAGRLGWELQPKLKENVKLVLLHRTGKPDSVLLYPKGTTLLHNLKPVTYTLTLAFESGRYTSANVKIKANGQTHVYFDSTTIKQASAESRYLLKLVEEKIKQLRKTEKVATEEREQEMQANQQTTYTHTSGIEHYDHEVTGYVTDRNTGEPLPGVAIILKGTTIGTATDLNGRYRLYVPADGNLVYRYVGYNPWEENVNHRESINVTLDVSTQALQEVVVVAYGLQERRALTGAVAGVVAGQPAQIRIRGVGSVNADHAKPLIIVDGVPYSGSLEDVKNIVTTSVLKGEEATAIYGSLAASGVVIITTKTGSATIAGDMLAEQANSIRNNFSDYAFWQPRLMTNKQGEAAFSVTFPDDITSWNTHVLAMNNRMQSGIFTGNIKSFKAMMATLHLPRFLVEGDKAHVVGKALNYLPDSAAVTTYFEVDGKKKQETQKQLNKSFTDTLQLTAPASPDSVEVLFGLRQASRFTDGERRFVNVYPKGVEETQGHFLPLYADTTFTLNFDPAKGPVTLQTQSDLLQVMLDEIELLRKYPYWCSEQAASKLKGLLLEKRIRTQLDQPFEHDRIVNRLIKHLEKTQLKNGAWTWWEQGPAYTWITNHVAEALTMAKAENYSVKFQEQKLTDYLVYTLESGHPTDKLTALKTLYSLKADVNYSRYIKELEKKKNASLEDQFRLTRLKQQIGLPVQLDTLQHYRKQTMLGGVYWGKEKYTLFDNSISNTLLAYQVLSAAGGQERELARIRAYLLSKRQTGHWRNTFESARVLETLLPDLLQTGTANKGGESNILSFSGAVNMQVKGFRADTTFVAGQPLTVQKKGKLPLYFTAYQTTWNKAPQAVEKDFIVKTTLKGLKENTVLQAGKPIEMLVEVEVKADADYVMIEVPIPASCSYESKHDRSLYEVHREYYRNKVNIFSDKLPKGKYTYTIKLLPRYTGTYTLNPAKAELMYFPTFFGRNKLKQVNVK
ncbi:carboxypeptidase-like regulatory domain-containing protein [Pontibacter populi]|uniref:Carboxypeptidase-like regulatory domain-containing protein n=1 Tax=Pontibacter populi TaxID=890055 RepID=A0ABV1RXX6_9BACT